MCVSCSVLIQRQSVPSSRENPRRVTTRREQADEGEDCQGLAEHESFDCSSIGRFLLLKPAARPVLPSSEMSAAAGHTHQSTAGMGLLGGC